MTILVVAAVLVVFGTLGVMFWWISTRVDYVTVTQARLKQRAHQQHRRTLRGDPRGFWGDYPPARTHTRNEMLSYRCERIGR